MIVATYLAPNLQATYQRIAEAIEKATGQATHFKVGNTLDDFAREQIDIAFLCGLDYVRLTEWEACPVEPLVAPVLQGVRYGNRARYFSDVVVRRESPYASFADLEGLVWAYNEKTSHSGYNLVYFSLLKRHHTLAYFGQMIESGSHQASLNMVLEGRADATALDSHMLDVALHHDGTLASRLRHIATLGPSPIPPVVVSKQLSRVLKQQLQGLFLTFQDHPLTAEALHAGRIDHFVPASDTDYQPVREMFALVQAHQAEASFKKEVGAP